MNKTFQHELSTDWEKDFDIIVIGSGFSGFVDYEGSWIQICKLNTSVASNGFRH